MNRQDRAQDEHLLSGAYVLHALTPEEVQQVDAAAEQSEELRGELAELADTAVLLGQAVPAMDPPAALRNRLLAAIATTPQLAPLPEPEEGDVVGADHAASEHVLATGTHVATGRRRVRRRPTVLIAVAAVAVLLFGGGLLVDRVVVAPQTEYAAITTAPDAQHSSAKVTGGGTATVYWSASEDQTAVVLHDVSAPSGKTLQLWKIQGKSVVSEGLYDAGSSFRLLSGTPVSGEKLAVSVEPAGGSTHPTTVPVTFVSLS